jgi:hypothetical protein
VSDEDLARTPYAELWLSELGATVPEHRAGEEVRQRRRPHELVREDLATRRAPDSGRRGRRA